VTNKQDLSRRNFLRTIGARSAVVVAASPALLLAKGARADDCPTDDIVFTNAIVGTIADGTGQDYSPTTGLERTAVPSACWQCVARDGIVGFVEDGQLKSIQANPKLPRTNGRICARGQGGVGQVYDPDRLLFPMRRTGDRGSHQWERISWDEALADLETKMAETRANDPGKFMFHYGRMKASSSKVAKSYFLPAYGSKSYGGHTSICESAKWTGQELVWGKHYDVNDFSRSQFIMIFGSNPLVAHTSHVAISTRLSKAIDDGVPVYTFDPRLSNTAANSTEWLPINVGTDLAVLLAMANHIATNGLAPTEGVDFINTWSNIDQAGFGTKFERLTDLLTNPQGYIAEWLDGEPDAAAYWSADDQPAGGYTPAWAEGISGIPAAKIEEIAEGYAAASPGATILTYRGAVMHFNGTMVEVVAQMLEGMCGNIDVPGGRVHAVGAKWSYKSTFPQPSSSGTSGGGHDSKGDYVKASHGTSYRVLDTMRDNPDERVDIYFVYCYTPAYANGDMQANIDILKDTSIIPYMVVSDVAYTEAAMYADLILPDATYLERWDWEDMVSYDQIHEYYIRQPVIAPLGEVRNTQDVLIDLAGRLSAGGDDKLEMVAAIGSMENYVAAACRDTAVVNDAGIAKGYTDGFEFMKAEGAWHDPDEDPIYQQYLDEVTLAEAPLTMDDADGIDDEDEHVWVDGEGIVWEATKEDFLAGYRNVSKSYKHYVGQVIDESGTVYKGFAPDKIDKSGWFELESPILAAKHFPPLPVWMYIPEHQGLDADELILTTFKMPTQTHSRTQNCKYLSEITHHEPAWINPTTAAAIGLSDGDEATVTRSRELINNKDMVTTRGTTTSTMTVEVKVTNLIKPGVLAISHHLGHWAYGRYASGEMTPVNADPDQVAHEAADPDAGEIWWDKHGYRGYWITPNAGEPIGGGHRCFDTVVRVAPA
jgi:thiosulfate reductase / polysulfide reductase chain A